jgi:hypothetical protein
MKIIIGEGEKGKNEQPKKGFEISKKKARKANK